MSNIKDKIEMELKPYETMCEQTTEHLKMLITGGVEASADEILTVAKALGEIIDIKKDIVEMCYKKTILEAMEESEYDVDYDENGRKSYRRMRDSRGRYMRGYEEPMHMSQDMRDMDRESHRRMYTDTNMNESKFERMRREYTNSKSMNPNDKQMHQDKMNKMLDAFAEEMKEMIPMMDSADKTIARTKLSNLSSGLN